MKVRLKHDLTFGWNVRLYKGQLGTIAPTLNLPDTTKFWFKSLDPMDKTTRSHCDAYGILVEECDIVREDPNSLAEKHLGIEIKFHSHMYSNDALGVDNCKEFTVQNICSFVEVVESCDEDFRKVRFTRRHDGVHVYLDADHIGNLIPVCHENRENVWVLQAFVKVPC